jgi:hypothetical protein
VTIKYTGWDNTGTSNPARTVYDCRYLMSEGLGNPNAWSPEAGNGGAGPTVYGTNSSLICFVINLEGSLRAQSKAAKLILGEQSRGNVTAEVNATYTVLIEEISRDQALCFPVG